MNIAKDIEIWLADILGISNFDRMVERKFWKMRRLYEIGDDVTIGAGAIVTKDVPSHSIVKGLNQIRPKRPDEIPDKYKIQS
jgi:hypothetical protein